MRAPVAQNHAIGSWKVSAMVGAMIGMLRYCSEEVAELFRLPDLYLSGFGLSRSTQPATCGETTFAIGAGCFEEEYQEQDLSVVTAYDKVQADYAESVQPTAGASVLQLNLVNLNKKRPKTTRKTQTIMK